MFVQWNPKGDKAMGFVRYLSVSTQYLRADSSSASGLALTAEVENLDRNTGRLN